MICDNQNFRKLPDVLSNFKEELEQILSDLNLDSFINTNKIREIAISSIIEDLEAYINEDPSVRGVDNVASEAKGFEAVRHYRYLNTIYKIFLSEYMSLDDHEEYIKNMVFTKIRYYSENIKNKTGVEIHPFATIGKRFIIDHGTGTVIGERTEIGDDCMILNDVILGSAFDPKVAPKDRHPKLGNGIRIYSGVRILGNIIIGNKCTIGTKCIVKSSLPDNSNVSIINQLQITRGSTIKKSIIYGIIPDGKDTIVIYGKNLLCDETLKADIIDTNYDLVDGVCTTILEKSESKIKLNIKSKKDLKNYGIKLYNNTAETIIKECICLLEIGG